MHAPEFTTAPEAPPARLRGRELGFRQEDRYTALTASLESLECGHVLRWRSVLANSNRAASAVLRTRSRHPGRLFTIRKADGGYDIYRIA